MAVKDFDAATLAHQVRDRLAPFRLAVSELQKWGAQISGNTPVTAGLYAGADTGAHDIDAVKASELDPDAKGDEVVGSVHRTGGQEVYRSALCIMFDNAVKGHAREDEIHYKERSGKEKKDEVTYFGPRKKLEYYSQEKTEDVATYARLWVMAEYNLAAPGQVSFTVRPWRGQKSAYGTRDDNSHMPGRGWLSNPHTWWEHYNLPLNHNSEGFRNTTYTSKDGALPQELQDDLIRLYKTGAERGLFYTPGTEPAAKPG